MTVKELLHKLQQERYDLERVPVVANVDGVQRELTGVEYTDEGDDGERVWLTFDKDK